MSLSMYSIHSSFPTFNIEIIEFFTLQIVMLTISETFSWISKKKKKKKEKEKINSYFFLDVLAGCKYLQGYIHGSD